MFSLANVSTPACLIDRQKMLTNVARLSAHIGALGCQLRPHVKTHKSIEVTKAVFDAGNTKGITVSTLKEARHFFQHGYDDILYAVGIVPNKLSEAAQLIGQGCRLTLVLDSIDMAHLVIARASSLNCQLSVMIELDTDGHRSGMAPDGAELLKVAHAIHESEFTQLKGVMTHAGESYNCFTFEEQLSMARQERDLSLLAAERIRATGIACPEVSIGSTPTAFAIDDLTGITEVRAGVYVFFDLVMAGLNVCSTSDIAISVLASVIGYQEEKNWVITDAGWMAMSRDRGTQSQPLDQGYGLVCAEDGKILNDYIIAEANQEHGILTHRHPASDMNIAQFPLASQIRILPNHACSTAAQFDRFFLVDDGKVVAEWPIIRGW